MEIIEENKQECMNFSSNHHHFKSPDGKPFKKIKKLLVANRGEIAIRVFRTCAEMGIRTVAIYSEEDRNQLHRMQADESYLVGKGLKPVAAYLNINEIIRVAKDVKVDAIHPGYGFLSEQVEFCMACNAAGIIFVGPNADVLQKMGNKSEARRIAIEANINLAPGIQGILKNAEEASRFAQENGLPMVLKAAYGGGGRGIRVVHKLKDMEEQFRIATSEALAAFGNGSLFIEKYIESPRHIEVQILGDSYGNVIHLFERDCSVQRRHQKLIEIAPAPLLHPTVRDNIIKQALNIARHVGYSNAGTVEFLYDQKCGEFYFMEVNARLQVEHTVTEYITNVDLVRAQILVAEGASLPDLNLNQENILSNGYSIQCRVTTEDPAKGFQPDFGVLQVFRLSGGPGIRIDSGYIAPGQVVTPYYDSLLVKLISHARNFEEACLKMLRALQEFRIRGVKTNIPFLQNVMECSKFRNETIDTSYIETHPELCVYLDSQNRAQKLLFYLSEVMVNGPMTPFGTTVMPADITPILPKYNMSLPIQRGWRQIFLEEGPEMFAKAVRANKSLLLMDTTFRDAHQSLLATRVRTHDMVRIAPFVATHFQNFYSMEMWGGATFDSCMRFLYECPWERIERLRELIPNIPFQMLLRASNAVGYTNYPDNLVYEFCKMAVKLGIDVFRIFDCMNYLPNLQLGIDAVRKAGGIVEASICYTGDICDPNRKKFTLEYYLNLVDDLVKAGTHILGIKDMAGLIKVQAASKLVKAIRERHPDLPIHVHTHDTSGSGVASMLAAAEAGADVVDVAVDSMSGLTSQPSMGAVVANLNNTPWDTGIDTKAISAYSSYWEQTRTLYGPFEGTVTMKSGNSDVYINEIPGGQYTNLQFQAFSLGLAEQFEEIKIKYAEANLLLGDIIKVTPSSKVVGDLAQFMVQNRLTPEDVIERAGEMPFPNSVLQFFNGDIGFPYGGFPQPLASRLLNKRKPRLERAGLLMEPIDFDELKRTLEKEYGHPFEKRDLISAALYPKVFADFETFRNQYGPVDRLATREFLIGPKIGREIDVEIETGKTLHIKPLAIGDVTAEGIREVFFQMNGQMRVVHMIDRTIAKQLEVQPKIVKGEPGSVGAPMPGEILEIRVKEGQKVEKTQPLATISAMKMEMLITAPIPGTVFKIHVTKGFKVQGDDLLFTIV